MRATTRTNIEYQLCLMSCGCRLWRRGRTARLGAGYECLLHHWVEVIHVFEDEKLVQVPSQKQAGTALTLF